MYDHNMAISDRTSVVLAEVCAELKPKVSIDLGTGTGRSLVVMATQALAGGVIWSVDNDPQFLKQARGIVAQVQHQAEIHFVHAPLKNGWYDISALAAIKGPVNLLFVDGPVGAVGRALALPTFLARLAPGAHVYLDDFNRAGEQNWFEGWKALLKESGFRFEERRIPTERGLGALIIGGKGA